MMTLCLVVTLCIVSLMVYMYFKSRQEHYIVLGAKTIHVQGVPLIDQKANMLHAAVESGMITREQIYTYLPVPINQGEDAYFADAAITNNTLELSPTLQSARLQLAAANTNFIPADGATPPALWNKRTTVDVLGGPEGQPGFSAQPVSPGMYPFF